MDRDQAADLRIGMEKGPMKHLRGFSLLEVLIALVILSIVLPGLVAMFMGSKRSQVGSFATEQASQFAEGKLDSLRWLGRSMLTPKNTWSGTAPAALSNKTAAWRWKFDTADGVAKRAGVLSVEVSWSQGKTPHAITLQWSVP